MVKTTKPGLDVLQSCTDLASHGVKDIKLESLITVGASVFALKITSAQLVVLSIFATAVFSHEGNYSFVHHMNWRSNIHIYMHTHS